MNSLSLVRPTDMTSSVSSRLLALACPEPNTGCWLFTGHITAWGYGTLKCDGRSVLAHRASYEAHIGPIPEGMLVCHRCDVPACVNPEHLFLGTHATNMADMKAKGRGRNGTGADPSCAARGDRHGTHTRPDAYAKGAARPGSKLTEDDVRAIRAASASGTPKKDLAKTYGVSAPTVSLIVARKKWKHVT